MSNMEIGKIIKRGKNDTWEKLYEDGTREIKYFTKTLHQERHAFIDPVTHLKTIIWKK